MRRFVPAQSQMIELLDAELADHHLLRDNLRDMARANRWLGAQRSVLRRVTAWLAHMPRTVVPRILDVATGNAAFPLALQRWSVRHQRRLTLLASDLSPAVLHVSRHEICRQPIALLRHDALRLPFADQSIDIVTCLQALHHFPRQTVAPLLRELARVARCGVIISDLRRSYLAYWGARLLANGSINRLSRHDGPLSVLRAYTPAELEGLITQAALPAIVRAAPGFRVEIELKKG